MATKRKNENDWESVRGRGWAKWVRTTAERILNEDPGLPPGQASAKVRKHLDEELNKANVAHKKPANAARGPDGRRIVPAREMDRLVGRGGNGWSRWEAGEIVPGRAKIDEQEKATGDATLNRKFWEVADGVVPGALQFWQVGPCRDDQDRPLPLWAMMQGITGRDALWLPVLRYREGTSDGHRSVAEVCELDGVAFHTEAGTSKTDDLSRGLRAWFAPDVPPEEQPKGLLDRNELYQADVLSRFTGQAFMRAFLLGSSTDRRENPDRPGEAFAPVPPPEEGKLYVADVLVLAVATSIAAGERYGIEWQEDYFEERVFLALRAVRPRVLAYAARFGVEAGVRRWVRRLHSDFLDRNGYGFTPVPPEYVGQDPEEVTFRRARADRPEGEKRYSARTRVTTQQKDWPVPPRPPAGPNAGSSPSKSVQKRS
ncbi:hypothetical protein [Burkholderia cepacia]|uniref:hypothetical protein n=1 Tax=Burkholderia cepacia TaxID=292 RepID=UPI003EE26265